MKSDRGSGLSVSLWQCRRRLTTLWFVAAGAYFTLLLLATVFDDPGRSGAREAKELWNWFLPTVVPSLSLMVGVLVANAGGAATAVTEDLVDAFLFRLSFWLSLLYLGALGLSFGDAVYLSGHAGGAIRQSNLWLGPLQGLVTGSLGAFFVHTKHAGSRQRGPA